MVKKSWSFMLPCVVLLTCASALQAQTVREGEAVYKETCAACHATGLNKAPKFGDKATWTPLIKEGQAVLTSHAWVGVRAMPAKGGRTDLSQEEFGRAVAYLARAAGGKWQDPDAAMLKRIALEEKKRLSSMNKAP